MRSPLAVFVVVHFDVPRARVRARALTASIVVARARTCVDRQHRRSRRRLQTTAAAAIAAHDRGFKLRSCNRRNICAN